MTITEIELSYAKEAYEKYLKSKSVNSKGCFIPRKKPRSDGYVRFSVPKGHSVRAFGYVCGERTFYIHQLAWYSNGYQVPDDSNRMQLSHLCSDPRCFNVKHLVLETPKENNSRKNCTGVAECPNCSHAFTVCKHRPKCITSASDQ